MATSDIGTAQLYKLLPKTAGRDRFPLQQELSRIKRLRRGGREERTAILRLEARIRKSIEQRRRRLARVPDLRYNRSLPIYSKRSEIVRLIRTNRVVIISGETGSGKTTQIPRFCLEAGRGIDGMIGCTQPRRIAAVTVAERIADEMGEELGKSIGYKIRFQDRSDREGFIKIMTDGILLAEAQRDPDLRGYDTLIIDEAHERSLNIDFVLGVIKTLLTRRCDLKLVVTSATIDTEKFSRAFGDAPVIEVSGRLFPVEARYLEAPTEEVQGAAFVERAVMALENEIRDQTGDVLIFMPTEESILETCQIIEGRGFKGTTVLPLFARLAAAEQRRIFAGCPRRKIIVATNIAETSLTIPGIKYVIDTGLARIPRYSARSRITSLPVVPISRSSADQRLGRCGRVRNGVCIRLYSQSDYASRPLFTPPEILRANLAEVVLRMLSRGLGDPSAFPFVDPPAKANLTDGFQILLELGAIRAKKRGTKGRRKGESSGGSARFALTERGRLMAELPLDPTLSRMLIEAKAEGCLDELLTLVAVLSIQDPRERPVEKAEQADQAQAVFKDPLSDFMTLLTLWRRYQKSTKGGRSLNLVGRFCRSHFLSFRRMREWEDVRHQLSAEIEESALLRSIPARSRRDDGAEKYPAKYCAVHRSILSGYLSNIASRSDKNIYRSTKGRELMIFPGSTLFNRAGEWIITAETIKTTRLYARIAANIEPHWIEEAGGDLCRRSYSEPHWDSGRNEVMACEKVSLFGLTIVPGRIVPYGDINPEESSDLFIRNALVDGEPDRRFPFIEHNGRLAAETRGMEDRLRRRGILAGDERLAAFYRERLPGVYDFSALSRLTERGDAFLRMKPKDLLGEEPESGELELYPGSITVKGRSFDCDYVFEPGAENDGLTLLLPVEVASLVPPESLEWLVPGLNREKIAVLIRGLPKKFRRRLTPLGEKIAFIQREMPRGQGSLHSALSEFILGSFGLTIPPAVFSEVSLPSHLRMRVSLRDGSGGEIAAGRAPDILRAGAAIAPGEDLLAEERRKWERSGITRWDFGDLPQSFELEGAGAPRWRVYPALAAEGEVVALRLFLDEAKAAASHLEGVALLYEIHFLKKLSGFSSGLRLPPELGQAVQYFGGEPRFVEMLWRRTIRDLFRADVRREEEFAALAERMSSEALAEAKELLKLVEPILTVYQSARSVLYGLRSQRHPAAAVTRFLERMGRDLERLLPGDFIAKCPRRYMPRLGHYVRALSLRAERGYLNVAKDQAKSRELELIRRLWRKQIEALKPSSSPEKRVATRDFAWLLEEYKITVFAPEVGTPEKISAKRLMQRLERIAGMV